MSQMNQTQYVQNQLMKHNTCAQHTHETQYVQTQLMDVSISNKPKPMFTEMYEKTHRFNITQ